ALRRGVLAKSPTVRIHVYVDDRLTLAASPACLLTARTRSPGSSTSSRRTSAERRAMGLRRGRSARPAPRR
ncbi:MAG: hypothetical protein AAFP86_19135, partial [Planctomycetota bacterium]